MGNELNAPVRLAPGLHRVEVPNTAGYSGQATNVYIFGDRQATIVDTGCDDGGATVLNALQVLGIGSVERIILTHAHQDHSGNASVLQSETGAELCLHPADTTLLARVDPELRPDRRLSDNERFEAGAYQLMAFETPGHAPGHMSLYEPSLRALFAGDLLSGNGTIAVVPPNGSMSDYVNSLRRAGELEIGIVYPGHGPAIEPGQERIAEYIRHREQREQDIFEAIEGGATTLDDITELLYADVQPRLRGLARGTVHAHVLRLIERQRVRPHTGGSDASAESFVAL